MIVSALTKKELKQNLIIYVIPFFILAALWLLFRNTRFLPQKWADILAVALPISLGGAYGLQSFDLEENGQTRDFLLTKPITISQILWTKFYTGLVILLPATFLWIIWLVPKTCQLPNPANPSSIWGLTVILLVLTVYITAFTMSIFIKGPLKIVGTLLVIPFIGLWFFFTWGELVTPIFWNDFIVSKQWLSLPAFLIATLVPVVMMVLLSHRISGWYISQQLFATYKKSLCLILMICLFIPLLFWGVNLLFKPAISPFNHLSASLLGIGNWFTATEGVKQPAKNQYAFSDPNGRLAIAKIGQEPQVIYSNATALKSDPVMLTNLAWSPDGKHIAFCENHRIKIYSINSHAVKNFAAGDIPLWSNDSRKLLIAKLINTELTSSPYGTVQLKKYQLTLGDLETNHLSSYGTLNSSGSSLAWDSIRNRLLTIDISGKLIFIDLTGSKVYSHSLLSGKEESVFLSQIQPVDAHSNLYELMVYTFNLRNRTVKTAKKYSLRRYLLNSKTDSIKRDCFLKQLSYKDVISTDNPRQIMVRSSDNGIYRLIKLPKEAKQ